MRSRITGGRGRKLGHALVIGGAAAFLMTPGLMTVARAEAMLGASVDDLLTVAHQLNPEIAAAAMDSQVAAAKVVPAGALDDPMLNLTRDQGFRQTTLTVSQDFPLWGKRGLREDAAKADATAVREREAGVVRELEERIKVAFARYYELDRAIRETGEIHGLLQTLSSTVRSHYAQGLSTQSDAIRAELEHARLDTQLSALKRDEESARASLNELVARPPTAPLADPQVLRPVPAVSSLHLGDLVERARSGNPALAAARAEIAAADAERQLVDKSWYPDVTLSVGADKLPDMSPQPVASIGIKLPFQGGVREAQAHAATAKKGAAQARLDGALFHVQSEIQSMLASLAQAQRTRDLLKSTLIPQSGAAYQSALVSYERGKGDLTPVVEAAHARLELKLELLRVETEEQSAFAAIERLAGDLP